MSSHGSSSDDGVNTDPQLTPSVKSVAEVLGMKNLYIPAYQRPYTWSVKNVAELLDDIRRFRRLRPTGQYRIGTFILNKQLRADGEDFTTDASRSGPGPLLDIVDGQQRYLSFALIAHTLLGRAAKFSDDLIEELRTAVEGIAIPRRRDGRSEGNLLANHEYLVPRVAKWTPEELVDFTEFFLRYCKVVVLEVRDLDSAFQMFDSQNTRGRPLYPTDLLKAYHLREFSRTDPSRDRMLETVQAWEEIEPEERNYLFAEVLFPIKRWSVNDSVPREGFTAQHVGVFKGIREDTHGNGRFRWARPALLAKAAVDRFEQENKTLRRHGVVEELEFPFQVTQPVIDGEMFFQMVGHYSHQARRAGIHAPSDERSKSESAHPDPELARVTKILDKMPRGTGNRYVRELFDCLLIAYVDRFGWYEVEDASFALARYAYLLRVYLKRVQVGSVDIHARRGHDRVQVADRNLFAEIAVAMDPHAILSRPVPAIPEGTETQALRNLYDLTGPAAQFEESE